MILLIAPGSDHGLRFNGSELAELVWEATNPAPATAPQCEPKTDSGVGRWVCTINYVGIPAQRYAPEPPGPAGAPLPSAKPGLEVIDVVVTPEGSMEGQTRSGKHVDGCCLTAHE